VQGCAPNSKDFEMTWVLLITFALIAAHILSDRVGRSLDLAKHAAHSLGGGMAIAYVFLHLLPELERGQRMFGHAVHIVALAGFVFFYIAEHWMIQRGEGHAGGFRLRIALHSAYNWLIVYSLPEAVEQGIGYALLLSVTLALHMMSTDYHLRSRNPAEFQAWGRWVLVAALVAGYVTDIFQEPVVPAVADTWTALLSGFVLSNVFRDESPDHSTARLRWFLGGVAIYTCLSLITH